MIETINNNSKVDVVEFYPDYSVICSVGKAPFYGSMEVAYKPNKYLLEFESFEAWIKSLAMQEMTIEDLCRLVFDELTAVLGDIPLRVTIHARTTVHAPASATIERKQGDT